MNSDGNIIISHEKMNSDGLYAINQKYQFITILDRNIPYDILKKNNPYAPWCWNMHTNICPNKITQSCR